MGGRRRRSLAWLYAAAELVWPLVCAGCDAPGDRLCSRCAALLRWSPQLVSTAAGPVWVATVYEDVPARLVRCYKDGGRLDLVAELAESLACAITPLLAAASRARIKEVWVVPVPSSVVANRRRGGDVVAAVARRAIRVYGHSSQMKGSRLHVRRWVVQRDGVRDQAGLGRSARWLNVRGALRVRWWALWGVPGRWCLIVDDVVTTGASVAHTAAAIRAAGGRILGVAAICATPPRIDHVNF